MERDEQTIKSFGGRIKAFRESKGWSQVDLAYEAGIDPRSVGRIEKGRQDPKLSVIVALAKALECKIEDIIVIN